MGTTELNLDEREEGEIVENNIEYEDISSDEESSLRQRIAELEARNSELEKIANISTLATRPYDYSNENQQIFAELPAENNFFPIRFASKSKGRHQFNTPHQHLDKNRNSKRKSSEKYYKKISQSKERRRKRFYQSSSEEEYELNRDELKAALKRDVRTSRTKSSLKKKLKSIKSIREIVIVNSDKEDDDELKHQLEALKSKKRIKNEVSSLLSASRSIKDTENDVDEHQLRLIALKSAYIKKHEARKKRKEHEERPYSPTDQLENIAVSPDIKNTEIENNMDISPVMSPITENYIPVDMDIVNGDSNSPVFFSTEVKTTAEDKISETGFGPWITVNSIPLPKENENIIIEKDNIFQGESENPGIFRQTLLAVNKEGKSSISFSLPKPFILLKDSLMEGDNIMANITNNTKLELLNKNQDDDEKNLREFLLSTKVTPVEKNYKHSSENEERAIILPKPQVLLKENEVNPSCSNNDSVADISLEADCLRSFLLSSMIKKQNLIRPQVQIDLAENIKSETEERVQKLSSVKQETVIKEVLRSIPKSENIINKASLGKEMVSNGNIAKLSIAAKEKPLKISENCGKVKLPTLSKISSLAPVKKLLLSSATKLTDAKFKVAPLIIQLGNSESDSDNNLDNIACSEQKFLYQSYEDIASPVSLILDSSCNSPASPNLPPDPSDENSLSMAVSSAPVVTTGFEQKLNEFLKNARCKADTEVTKINAENVETKPSKTPITPLAVQHLPASSQIEYRRLVNRMTLLEKQKRLRLQNLKQIKVPSNDLKVTIKNILNNDTPTKNGDRCVVKKMICPSKSDSLIKKVLVKTSTIPHKIVVELSQSPNETIANKLQENVKQKCQRKLCDISPPKKASIDIIEDRSHEVKDNFQQSDAENLKALEIHENEFANYSTTFLHDLENLLSLVYRAQSEKQKQVKLENQLEELKKQMVEIENELAQQQKIINKLNPTITKFHKNIIKNRNKCAELNDMCLKMGKKIKGSDYKLSTDCKKKVIEKFKILTAEAKKLKTIGSTVTANKPHKKLISTGKKSIKNSPNKISIDETVGTSSPEPEKIIPSSVDTNAVTVESMNQRMSEYKSPLDHMTSQDTSNPDGVVCPFQLMGECEDKECTYKHLPNMDS